MNALRSLAQRDVRPTIAQLQEEGRYISLIEFGLLFDAALEAFDGEDRTRSNALMLQALVYLGIAARYFAPNRPGVLRVMSVTAGCISPTCRDADCQGNYVAPNGHLHVKHDKTEASHGPRPPLPCPEPLRALLEHWLGWGRALVRGNTRDTGALFLYPTTGASMTEGQSSAFMPLALRLISGDDRHITATAVRPRPRGHLLPRTLRSRSLRAADAPLTGRCCARLGRR
jgi:hypothetical protein